MTPYRSIGIMSGTSGDGIDAVLLELDDVYVPHTGRILARASLPFEAALSEEIVQPQALTLKRLTELHYLLPSLYAQTAQMLPEWQTAQCCGVHGQTVAHQVHVRPPQPRGTLQIGVSSKLAALLQMPVVGDLRSMDVALGGQGAPIVPIAHWFFLGGNPEATLVVNLGGICNITLATPALEAVQGYDVGPGMMLSDAYARTISNGALTCDKDGALSAGGKLVPELLQELLAHPFVARQAPKSAGREEFGRAYYEPLLARYQAAHSSADIMVTLIEATAQILHHTMVRDFGARLPFARLVLTGGGALNPRLRAAMAKAFAPLPVQVEQEGVLAPQNHEPAAMALIASRTLHGLPSALPQVTGAPYGSVLGHICRPTPAHLRLPSPAVLQGDALLERLRGQVAQKWQHTAARMRADGAATAISFALHHQGTQVLAFAEGQAQRFSRTTDAPQKIEALAHPPKASPQSLFDVASITKTACTTACIMALISDGRLALHARASTFVPELRHTDKADITVQQLLSHRSGLSAWAPLYLLAQSPKQALAWIAQSALDAPPGTRRLYSDLGFILLGAVIEAITGAPLSAYFEARIAQPLGLTRNDVRFGPVGDHDGHIVATAHDNSHEQRMIEDPARNAAFVSDLANSQESRPLWRTQTFVGEVNDGNAHHVFGGTAAHAGLFATASAISALLASMTASGHRGHLGSKLFGQEVVHTFLRPAAGDDYLGWANPCTWQSLAPWHPTLAAHGCVITEGFTGCMGFGVPSLGLTVSMLANRQHQGTDDPAAMPKLYPYWAQIIEALVCALNP